MANQKKVVFEYLEALLHDPLLADDAIADGAAEDNDVETAALDFDSGMVVAGDLEPMVPSEPVVVEESSTAAEPADTITAEPEPEPEPEVQPMAQPAAAMPPAQPLPENAAKLGAEVNCILVDMHGLKLAIPFDRVEGSLHLIDLSMALDGPDWMIGRFGESPVQTRIVDTARWLIPERYQPEYSKYSEIVILHGRRWALACDELVQSVRIPTNEINWNRDQNHRAWLLGTYMPERCAILDIDQLLLEFEACSV